MSEGSKELRRGWTTGACATAAVKAALEDLWRDHREDEVRITLPRGERVGFAIAQRARGAGWAEAAVVKDAGDDPDVTHGALIVARVGASSGGVVFRAGEGVGSGAVDDTTMCSAGGRERGVGVSKWWWWRWWRVRKTHGQCADAPPRRPKIPSPTLATPRRRAGSAP